MANYAKSIIYTIQKDELVYVGSTTNFIKRKSQHKHDCNNETSKHYNLKVYTMIRANGGFSKFQIKPYSEFPCETKIALVIEEERVRKLIGNMNSCRAHTTKEERANDQYTNHKKYYEENKVEIAEQKKIYADAHKVEIAEYQKIYNEENKVEIAATHKIYYEENKVEFAEKNKLYYAANADAIKLRASIQIECKCGKTYCNGHKARHERTPFHINSMFENAKN